MSWFLIIIAYILGSIPSGIVVARIMGGADPRSGGSGNIGATNVLRTLGRKAAAATLAGDVLKGVIPVLIARAILPDGSSFLYLTAGAAILGHDFSFLLSFKGGKGVATTFGALAALGPAVALLCLVTWISVVAVTRYSSAGALSTASVSPLFALFVARDGAFALFCVLAAALLIFLHRENIKRLMAGTERRIGTKN
ncbi:MAG: glycerol-3-phosphate 1-O-acyltransferase PlsY [bacterium]|nr:glycerol-3-phosphate 1-O-acyltransferase PlsY [bacterium]